jgi:Nidogen-like/PEP-CTERM motif
MFRTLFLATALFTAALVQGGAIIAGLNPGSNTLAANDDGSSPLTPIGFSANFFGSTFTQLYANNNANVTFNGPLSTYTPFGLTTNIGTPIIAPFFADVDTRGAGSGLLTYGARTFSFNDAVVRNVFVGNWINVGYFANQTNKLNSIQLVLISRQETGAGNFDIMFNYDGILWETGGASGGVNGLGGNSAHAGYSAGTGVAGSFFEFAGSGVNGALLDGGPNSLIASSNVAATDPLYSRTNGRYVFNVRNGVVSAVPEPGTWALTLMGLGFGVLRMRKRS